MAPVVDGFAKTDAGTRAARKMCDLVEHRRSPYAGVGSAQWSIAGDGHRDGAGDSGCERAHAAAQGGRAGVPNVRSRSRGGGAADETPGLVACGADDDGHVDPGADGLTGEPAATYVGAGADSHEGLRAESGVETAHCDAEADGRGGAGVVWRTVTGDGAGSVTSGLRVESCARVAAHRTCSLVMSTGLDAQELDDLNRHARPATVGVVAQRHVTHKHAFR